MFLLCFFIFKCPFIQKSDCAGTVIFIWGEEIPPEWGWFSFQAAPQWCWGACTFFSSFCWSSWWLLSFWHVSPLISLSVFGWDSQSHWVFFGLPSIMFKCIVSLFENFVNTYDFLYNSLWCFIPEAEREYWNHHSFLLPAFVFFFYYFCTGEVARKPSTDHEPRACWWRKVLKWWLWKSVCFF